MGNGRAFARNLQPVPPSGEPVPQPMAVPPSPVPTQVDLAQVPLQGGKVGVALQFSTPVGVAVYFLPADIAAELARKVGAISSAAMTGLVVPV